ncbi:MAG: hypothetical protein O2968_02210 [Acidobacteria bacterium]|nr:hypothetical protein [Acidobacteriota bacterium]
MHRFFFAVIAAAIVGYFSACSIPSDSPREPKAEATRVPTEKPRDETRRFPSQGRVSVEIVDNHVMGKDFLPGGNVAQYDDNGKQWRQFLVAVDLPTSAALLLNEYRGEMEGPKYLAHMGGYFGKDGSEDVLVMQKGRWLMGIAGLPQQEADMVARGFAARLD